jgi:hypothetical protein
VPVAAPADAASWLDADTHALLAREAPGAVGMAVKKELLAPMQQWLAAYDVAQVCSDSTVDLSYIGFEQVLCEAGGWHSCWLGRRPGLWAWR